MNRTLHVARPYGVLFGCGEDGAKDRTLPG